MAASHVAVETGGKSRLRFSISAPAWASGMGALLDDLEQIAEGGGFGGLGVKEEDGSARSEERRAWSDWSSDVCSSDLYLGAGMGFRHGRPPGRPRADSRRRRFRWSWGEGRRR